MRVFREKRAVIAAAKVLKFVFARRFSRKNTQLITVAANFKYTCSCTELIV